VAAIVLDERVWNLRDHLRPPLDHNFLVGAILDTITAMAVKETEEAVLPAAKQEIGQLPLWSRRWLETAVDRRQPALFRQITWPNGTMLIKPVNSR